MRVFEGETIYDYAWYPFMSSEDPATCCFASTSRVGSMHLHLVPPAQLTAWGTSNAGSPQAAQAASAWSWDTMRRSLTVQGHPVHLWDALTGRLRATYAAHNAVDEVSRQSEHVHGKLHTTCACCTHWTLFRCERPSCSNKHWACPLLHVLCGTMQQLSCVRAQVHAATSVAFSQDGSLIFGGFDKKLAVFDLSRPGHGCRELVTKRRREEGLPGAVQPSSLCEAT